MSTQIVDNFKLNVAKPIDSRMVTTGTASRNSLTYIYEGLRVYDLVNKAPYVYIGGSWQQESSSSGGIGGGSGGGGLPTGTQDRLLKYVNSTTVGDSTIFDKGTYISPNVGIGISPDPGVALHVNGILKSTSLKGTINGSYVDNGSIDNTKIIPGSEGYSLKTIGGQVVWTLSDPLNVDIVVANENSSANIHYLLFANTSNSPTGTRIYANNGGARLIGIKPSTSQILASGDSTNNETAPTYAFSTNITAGLYGNINEVGLSFNSKSLLKLNNSNLSIFDTAGTSVLSTGTNKVSFISGEFSGTLGVTGLATIGSLSVTTTSTFNGTINTATLNVAGTATINNLTVTGTTIFNGTINTGSLIVTGKSTTLDLEVTGTTTIPSLTLGGTLTVTGSTNLSNLTVTGTTTFTGQIQGPMTIPDLTIMGTLRIGTSYTITSAGVATFNSVNVTDPGGYSNTSTGTIYCNRIRIRPTSKSIPTGTSTPGYSLGDIIFVKYDNFNGKFWFNNGPNATIDPGGWVELQP